MREGRYQKRIIERVEELLPGCVIIKNDPTYLQGILDLTIFWEDRWGMLEVKTSEKAAVQPNQEYYVDKMHQMSFAAFIYPENEDVVLHDLQSAFGVAR